MEEDILLSGKQVLSGKHVLNGKWSCLTGNRSWKGNTSFWLGNRKRYFWLGNRSWKLGLRGGGIGRRRVLRAFGGGPLHPCGWWWWWYPVDLSASSLTGDPLIDIERPSENEATDERPSDAFIRWNVSASINETLSIWSFDMQCGYLLAACLSGKDAGLSLADFPWSMPDLWSACDHLVGSVRYGSSNQANSAYHPGVGKWVVIRVYEGGDHWMTDHGCVWLFGRRS